jgi:cobalt transporter subunit CbtA
LLAALLHFAFVQKYILLGEQYESGAAIHFSGVAEAPADGTAAEAEDHDHVAGVAHDHAHSTAAPGDDAETSALRRNSLTVLFAALVYAGYGMLLVSGFALAERFGKKVAVRDGIFWGVAGYAALQLMPAMGLAPELPGTMAADLDARQLWWLGTASATAAALALIAYGRGMIAYVAAVVLLALPHLIGAPELEGFTGVAPPEIAASFAARALGVGLIAWTFLGWLAARFWNEGNA